MNNRSAKPIAPTSEQLYVDLRRLEWAEGLGEETLIEIINTTEWVEFQTGEVVIEVESEITHAYFLVTGRLEATLYDSLGKEIQRYAFVRGSVPGLFSLGLSDRSYLHIQAAEPSTAIRLTLSDLLQLTAKHADFQLAMFRLSANMFKRYVTVDRSLPKPSVVGIIHHSEVSRPLTGRLARRLRDLDESLCIAGDDEQWKPDGDFAFKLLRGGSRGQAPQDVLKDWAADKRLLVDVRADHSPEAMRQVLGYVDVVLWCVRPQDTAAAVHLLQGLEKTVPEWRDKIRIVWILDSDTAIAPHVPEFQELAQRDFKLTFDAPETNQSSLLQHGFERIIHHLRGIRIGLALGGGAARGMAHFGVLKALEQNGIYVDMLSGTSAGAMVGTLYAAGLDPAYLTHVFKTDLKPSWFFRQLEHGGYWYLLYMYRRHKFDSMLRKYLRRARMEQLILPVFTISVDLVEGQPVVSEVEDATLAILEKHQSSSPFASYHRVESSIRRWRVAQQCSRQCAGGQGMQLCHRIDCDSKARETH